MRILHVIPGISPLYGGPTKVILEMCEELCHTGVQAEIATTDADIEGNITVPLGEAVRMKGVTVYCFRCPSLRKYGFSQDLTRWIKAHAADYDLLHIHAFFSYVTAPITNYARKYGIPYVIRPSGELNPWSLQKSPFRKSLYLSVFGKDCLKNASAVHVTSEDEREAVNQIDPEIKTAVIPLGLRSAHENEFPHETKSRKAYDLPKNKKLIAFISRLDSKKGLDLLLPSIKELSDQRDDFALVIAGSGERRYEQALNELVRRYDLHDRVIFTGFLQGREKAEILKRAHLFVLPSYDENFGLAVVEALSFGLPVVISNNVAIHHEVSQYNAGLVTACDSAALTNGLRLLLDNEPLRKEKGENALRLFEERFVWEKITARLISLYTSILTKEKCSAVAVT